MASGYQADRPRGGSRCREKLQAGEGLDGPYTPLRRRVCPYRGIPQRHSRPPHRSQIVARAPGLSARSGFDQVTDLITAADVLAILQSLNPISHQPPELFLTWIRPRDIPIAGIGVKENSHLLPFWY